MKIIKEQIVMLRNQSAKLFESGKIDEALKVNQMIVDLAEKIEDPDPLLTEAEAAKKMRITVKRLAEYRKSGEISVIRHTNKVIFYRTSIVDEFIVGLEQFFKPGQKQVNKMPQCDLKVS